jgi:integrase/recombinase XerD
MTAELEPIAPTPAIEPGAPALPAGPLARLPALEAGADPYWRLVTAFQVGYPPHSSRAYFSDLKAWHAWCTLMGVHPLSARRHHVDVWVRHLSEEPSPRPAASRRRVDRPPAVVPVAVL